MMYTFEDFKGCRFNPLTEELYDTYPTLETAMAGLCPDERVMRYIVMVYDPGSPLIQAEPALDRRKQEAIKIAGVPETMADELKDLDDEKIIEAVVMYLFNFTNNKLWQRIVVNEQLYEEYCKRLLQPVMAVSTSTHTDGEGNVVRKGRMVMEKDELQAYTIKAKLREELDTIGAALEGYYKQAFSADEKLVKKNKVRFTPESMAGIR